MLYKKLNFFFLPGKKLIERINLKFENMDKSR